MTYRKLVSCFFILAFFMLVPISVYAAPSSGEDPDGSVQDETAAASESEGSEAAPVTVEVTSPMYTYDNGQFVMQADTMPAADTPYYGTWSGSILDYFAGVMRKHPGVHYVAYRGDQYNYWLFYGRDLSASGSVVSGTGSYLHYYSGGYNSDTYLVRGTSSVEVSTASGFVYTDLLDTCSELEGVSNVNMQTILCAGAAVALALWVLSRIWWRGR